METPYKAISFVKHEILSRDRLDQLQANYQWINDNTPRGRLFMPNRPAKNKLLVIIGGKRQINRDRKNARAKASVKFGRAFAPNCNPNVTTGIVADFQRHIFCVVNGPKGKALPDSTGFEIAVAVQDDPTTKKTEVIKKDFFIHWSAFGYRTDDMNAF